MAGPPDKQQRVLPGFAALTGCHFGFVSEKFQNSLQWFEHCLVEEFTPQMALLLTWDLPNSSLEEASASLEGRVYRLCVFFWPELPFTAWLLLRLRVGESGSIWNTGQVGSIPY